MSFLWIDPCRDRHGTIDYLVGDVLEVPGWFVTLKVACVEGFIDFFFFEELR